MQVFARCHYSTTLVVSSYHKTCPLNTHSPFSTVVSFSLLLPSRLWKPWVSPYDFHFFSLQLFLFSFFSLICKEVLDFFICSCVCFFICLLWLGLFLCWSFLVFLWWLHRLERLRSRPLWLCGRWLLQWIERDVIIVIAGARFSQIVVWFLRRWWASR
jgi:hypothetical protein